MHYEDFIVELGPETAEGIQVKGRCVLAGEARSRLELPCPPQVIAERFAVLARGGAAPHLVGTERHLAGEPFRSSSGVDGWGEEELGTALFDAIFSGDVLRLWDSCRGALSRAEVQGLRIKIKLDLGDPVQVGLHALPWELLYQAQTGDRLGLSRKTPVVRHLELARAITPVQIPKELRVLVVAPRPRGVPPLSLETECENLISLGHSMSGLDVQPVQPATLGALRRALLERETHVVHFMGHGQVEATTGRGVLAFEATDGGLDPVTADSLAAVLKDFPSVRLVVLNACETARAGGDGARRPYAGLAPALAQGGIAGVLAMQLPILDAAAIDLSQTFYERLVAGDPVDAAAAEGRHAMRAGGQGSVQWAVPVLFLRVPDGGLFQLRKSRSEQASEVCTRTLAQVRAGSYDDAVTGLRQELSEAPERGLVGVALGIALARGRSLRRLPFQTAQEMHRLFAAALSTEDGKALAVAALLVLKADYFQPGSVREPPPSGAELAGLLEDASLSAAEAQLLACLNPGDRGRRALAEAGIKEEGT